MNIENTPRSTEEVIARVKELENGADDFFGFISSDLLSTLTFEQARPWLRGDASSAGWSQADRSIPSVIEQMRDYLPFAWDKANNQRGLSAGRSINHMQAWLWLLGEQTAAEQIKNYSHYGKPQLRAISEAIGFDWLAEDDGDWSNTEGGPYQAADQVAHVALTFVGPLAKTEA